MDFHYVSASGTALLFRYVANKVVVPVDIHLYSTIKGSYVDTSTAPHHMWSSQYK